MSRAAGLVLGLALAGCGSDDNPGVDAAAAGAPAQMTFSVSNGVRQSTSLVDPLIGTIYGQVFLMSEVTLSGPIEGAREFGAAEITGVDLEANMMAGAWTTPVLAPGEYTFLGFFDVDGNGATSRSPDMGDPVTFPNTIVIEIVDTTPVTVTGTFDLVYNF